MVKETRVSGTHRPGWSTPTTVCIGLVVACSLIVPPLFFVAALAAWWTYHVYGKSHYVANCPLCGYEHLSTHVYTKSFSKECKGCTMHIHFDGDELVARHVAATA